MKEQAQNRHKTWANEVHWWCLDLYLTVNLQRKSFILSPKCDFTTFWWWFPAFSWKSSSSVAKFTVECKIHIQLNCETECSSSRWIVKFLNSSKLESRLDCPVVWIPAGIQKVHLIFFSFAGRKASTSTSWALRPRMCGSYYSFCISGRKAWNA